MRQRRKHFPPGLVRLLEEPVLFWKPSAWHSIAGFARAMAWLSAIHDLCPGYIEGYPTAAHGRRPWSSGAAFYHHAGSEDRSDQRPARFWQRVSSLKCQRDYSHATLCADRLQPLSL